MINYLDMAKSAKITKLPEPPDREGDTDEIKKLKKTQLWGFDFSKVIGAPCTSLGEHADTEHEAIAAAATRLESMDKDSAGLAQFKDNADKAKKK